MHFIINLNLGQSLSAALSPEVQEGLTLFMLIRMELNNFLSH